MAYCTQDDIIAIEPLDNLRDLTDDEGTGSIVSHRVTSAIAAADAEIDSAIRGRVESVPLVDVPEAIKNISAELAIIRLYKRRFGMNMPEGVIQRMKMADKKLSDIQAGKITISTEHRDMAPSISATVSAPEQIYTSDMMSGF